MPARTARRKSPTTRSQSRGHDGMRMESLQDLFVHEIKDLYSAEQQILKALPKMIKEAASDDLRQALEQHLDQTRGHVERLDRVFDELGEAARGQRCKGMEGLIEEGSELLKERAEDSVKDAGIIAAAQRVEHYEMAAYGTARTFAQTLGHEDAVPLLEETLREEKEADKTLTEIAERAVNMDAAEGDGASPRRSPLMGGRMAARADIDAGTDEGDGEE
jgi:ferritin-like metal-binding protein YciE